MFRSARLKLTAVYTAVIALVMAAFSVALYVAIASATASNAEVPESTPARVEQALLAAQLERARFALAGINVAGWVLAAGASYLVAGRTLRPLEDALVRQRLFAAHASHELRTPLTVIKGEIDVTRARERTPEQYRETLDRVDEEVVTLEATVADLLSLARLESREGAAGREQRDVCEAVTEIVRPFREQAAARGIVFRVSIPQGLRARLDWPQVHHLLRNLLDNAVRHTAPLGEIEVRVGRRGTWIELSVYNMGSPVARRDLPHLFVPFYRGSGTDPSTGIGLGLALCEWIARSHGGSIAVRNVPGGVLFTVALNGA